MTERILLVLMLIAGTLFVGDVFSSLKDVKKMTGQVSDETIERAKSIVRNKIIITFIYYMLVLGYYLKWEIELWAIKKYNAKK